MVSAETVKYSPHLEIKPVTITGAKIGTGAREFRGGLDALAADGIALSHTQRGRLLN